MVEEAFADIPRLHPHVRQVIPVAWRRWRSSIWAQRSELVAFVETLRSERYDVVIDSQGLIKSAIITLLARGRRAGYSHTAAREPWAAFCYDRRVLVDRSLHAIERQRGLFAAVLDYDLAEDWRSGIEVQPEGHGRRVLFLHGTTWPSKHWPENMWLALVEAARTDGIEVLVTWGSDEEKLRAERLARAGAHLVARMPIGELVGMMRGLSAVVTVDSGLGHLSAALGIPTLGLYGATDGDLTGCRGLHARHLMGRAPCSPCLRRNCDRYEGEPPEWHNEAIEPPCFSNVLPDRVWHEVKTMIGAPVEVGG